MEKIKMNYNSKKYGFCKGEEFAVKRTIMGECVVIRSGNNEPNIIMSERLARHYGTLTGKPQLG